MSEPRPVCVCCRNPIPLNEIPVCRQCRQDNPAISALIPEVTGCAPVTPNSAPCGTAKHAPAQLSDSTATTCPHDTELANRTGPRERLAAELRDAVGDHYDNGKMSDPFILWHEAGIPDAIDWLGAADVLIAAGCQMGEPDSEWSRHMRSLLGKRVVVTIENDGPKPVEVTGTLLWFSNNGEVCLRDEEGFTGCAWPNLETRAAE